MKKKKQLKELVALLEEAGFAVKKQEGSSSPSPAPTPAALHALRTAMDYLCGVHADPQRAREAIDRALQGVQGGAAVEINGMTEFVAEDQSIDVGSITVSVRDNGKVCLTLPVPPAVVPPTSGPRESAQAAPAYVGERQDGGLGGISVRSYGPGQDGRTMAMVNGTDQVLLGKGQSVAYGEYVLTEERGEVLVARRDHDRAGLPGRETVPAADGRRAGTPGGPTAGQRDGVGGPDEGGAGRASPLAGPAAPALDRQLDELFELGGEGGVG